MHQSDDHQSLDRTVQPLEPFADGEKGSFSQASCGTYAKVELLCSCLSLDTLFDYWGFNNVRSQQVSPWIDPYDFSGGEVVRAVCANVAPSTMVSAVLGSAKMAGLTCDMRVRQRLKITGNPKKATQKSVSTRRSLRRVLRHKRKVK
tara:strand:+ start:448 stop:888 length:441 start_codon:yes stop_codon:yes gene_type:complete